MTLKKHVRRPKNIEFKPSPRDPLYEISPRLRKVNNYLQPIRKPLYKAANLIERLYKHARKVLKRI